MSEAVAELSVLRDGEHRGRGEVEHSFWAGGSLVEAGFLGLGEVMVKEIEGQVGEGRGGLINNIAALNTEKYAMNHQLYVTTPLSLMLTSPSS